MRVSKNEVIVGISVLITGLLLSCKSNTGGWEREVKSIDDMFRAFDNEVKLTGEIYIDDSIHLFNPFAIKIVRNYLLIQEIGNSEGGILSIFDMNNKQFIGKMFKYGNGPNEFLGLRPNLYGNDTLLILDPAKKTALLFGMNELKTVSSIPVRIIKFKSPAKGEQIDQCYLFGNKLICSGQFQKGCFQVYDVSGNFLYEFGEYPEVNLNENKMDNMQLGSILGIFVSFGKDSHSSKLANVGTSSLSIYDYHREKGEFSARFFAQWSFDRVTEASYIGEKPHVRRDPKVGMVGAGNIAANDDYLFFLVSKYKVFETMNAGIENRYPYIFVTNWDGKPIAKLVLDNPVHFPLEIDPDGKHLYSIHTDMETGFPKIIRYNISFLNN